MSSETYLVAIRQLYAGLGVGIKLIFSLGTFLFIFFSIYSRPLFNNLWNIAK